MGMELKVKRCDRPRLTVKRQTGKAPSGLLVSPGRTPRARGSSTLPSRAHRISRVENGKRVVSALRRGSPSVAFCDFAVVRRCRARASASLTPSDARTLTRRRERRSHGSLLSHAGQSNTPNDTRTSSEL